MSRPAVILDRDGTLIHEARYLDRLERLQFFPYTIDAVRLLNRAGFAVVVATNQAGVARALMDESFIAEAHREIAARLASGGARVDGWYYCPHHPEGVLPEYRQRCDCRKPKPGMLRRAAEELDLDLARSFGVGDRWHDVEAAAAVGARPILVRTGYGREEEAMSPHGLPAPVVVENLIEAVSWILQQS